MFNFLTKLIIGDMEDKRAYRQMKKRVDALPKDYRFAFHKIQHYMFSVGPLNNDMTIFTNLVDLFETSAANDRQIIDVIGSDVSKFCDEFMLVSITDTETLQEKLNNEIIQRFNKEGNHNGSSY